MDTMLMVWMMMGVAMMMLVMSMVTTSALSIVMCPTRMMRMMTVVILMLMTMLMMMTAAMMMFDMMLIQGGFVKMHPLGNMMTVPRRDCSRRPPGIRDMMTMLTGPKLKIVKIIHRRDCSGMSKRSRNMVMDQPHTDQSWLRRVSRVDHLSKEVRLMRPLL